MKKYIQMWFKCICMLTCCFLIVNTCPVYYHASDSGNDLSTVEDAALPEVSENNCVLTDVPESHDTEEGAFLENYPDSDDEESLVVETGSVANVSNDTDDGSEVYVPETIISDETSDDDSLQIQGASVEGSDSVLEITSEGVDLAEENYVTVAGSSENGVIASATSGSCGENASYTIDENEVCTITGTGEISAPYYTWCGVKKIIISEGITSIGENAFREYNNLYSFTEVVLPDTLVSIKSGAFFANRELESINFPEGLKEIADNSFGFCGLKTVVLPSTIEKIGDSAFAMLEKCTDFIIEDGASANADLHWQVVYGTDSLKRIVSPNCAFANMACRGAGTVEDSYTSITITKSFEKKFSYPYGDTHARHIDTY